MSAVPEAPGVARRILKKRLPRPVRFRVYPERRSRLYFGVVVWPTLKSMRVATATSRSRGATMRWETLSFRKGTQRKDPIMGEIHLSKRHLTMEVLTHELMHATLTWARRKGLQEGLLNNDCEQRTRSLEERVCYAHGRMGRDLVARCIEKGLLP